MLARLIYNILVAPQNIILATNDIVHKTVYLFINLHLFKHLLVSMSAICLHKDVYFW